MMGKLSYDNRQLFNCISSPSSIQSPPADSDMNWHATLSQSDSSIQQRPNRPVLVVPPPPPPTLCGPHSASYKVSIGHETVNITELARPHDFSSDQIITVPSNDRRRFLTAPKGANILSLCFMCFVSASLILISLSAMQLLFKTNPPNPDNMMPFLLQSVNVTPGFLYMFTPPNPPTDKIPQLVVPLYDHTIRDLATTICLFIIVLNCFSLLVFSIEIYLGCNIVIIKHRSHRHNSSIFSSSSSRFLAICSFYASIPALILVMSFFILLNMSLIPAIVSLIILGFGLIFILFTLLAYFLTIKTNNHSTLNGKFDTMSSSLHQTTTSNHLNEDDIDLTKADELSTLV
ncbi:unnamed protein product [Adineta ricciae]|uniref:Uncharacterized protein n=1 Tax=Adineta ricciae TaxID=249248 RepID=A0A814JYF0_ADIRI|nr:unnamed protein product [Adineta ricciae]CAF1331217.1 unnamed protein product [Adineta ricciae]